MSIMIYYGNDAFRVLMKEKELLATGAGKKDGIDDEVIMSLSSFSLFGGTTSWVIEVEDVDSLEISVLKQCMKSASCEISLFITKTVNNKGRVYKTWKEIQDTELPLCALNKFEPHELRQYVGGELKKHKRMMEKEAYEELIARTAYLDLDSVDLGTVVNELNKLLSLERDIVLDDVKEITTINPVVNIFSFADAVIEKRKEDAIRMASVLMRDRNFEALSVMSLLEQRYRVAYKASLFQNDKEARKSLNVKLIPRIESSVAKASLMRIGDAKRNVKSGLSDHVAFVKLVAELVV